WLDTVFSVVLAATIISSIRIMGVTLIAASLVIPPVIARLLTDRFAAMLVLSTAIGAAIGFVGMFVSYWFDVASGASIVLLAAALFALTLTYTAIRAWIRTGRPSFSSRELTTAEREVLFD